MSEHAHGGRDESEAAEEATSSEPDQAQRATQHTLWVDLQIRQAMRQGKFDDLPGTGKPINGLGDTHDPDWWTKNLIEREQITGLGPPAILLRKEDAELDAQLDRETSEVAVRRIVEDFNARVVEARRQLLGGPPVITATRDADEQVAAWRARLQVRRERQRAEVRAAQQEPAGTRTRRRWWPFGTSRS